MILLAKNGLHSLLNLLIQIVKDFFCLCVTRTVYMNKLANKETAGLLRS
jgi:hypothetical protein